MVLKPEPIFKAFEAIKAEHPGEKLLTILLSPQGRLLDQGGVQLSEEKRTIRCAVADIMRPSDERVLDVLLMRNSRSELLLTGGELGALVVIDAAGKAPAGVLGDEEAAYRDDRDGLLDHPHYTRPGVFLGRRVPDVLLGRQPRS